MAGNQGFAGPLTGLNNFRRVGRRASKAELVAIGHPFYDDGIASQGGGEPCPRLEFAPAPVLPRSESPLESTRGLMGSLIDN